MRQRLSLISAAALAGLLLGAGWGVLGWSPTWPGLSQLAVYRGAAFGWSAGLVLGCLVSWLLARRGSAALARPADLWQRGARILMIAAALAPLRVWVTAPLPGSTFHKALTWGRPRGETRPNLILITVDALRQDHVGAYGHHRGLTPAIDAFAAGATVYDAAYAASPWTLTSLASLFTLLPPSQCRLKATPREGQGWYWKSAALSDDIPLIPERLRAAGYVTAAELTNPFLSETRGWWRGFEYFHHEPMPEGMAPDMTRAEDVTASTTEWLTRNRREPFFLWVHYLDPHGPYDAPTTPRALRARYPKWRAGEPKVWQIRKGSGNAKEIAAYQAFNRAMYAEEVRYADHAVGELLRRIKAAGLWDRSLIIITADHGEELFEHGGLDHGHTMHQELLAVPLIVKWPAKVVADRRVTQTVGLSSVGASFLQSAGLEAASGAVAPPLPRRNAARGDVVYSEAPLYGAEQTALTTDQWRVIYHPTERSPAKQFEVYDRRKDSAEQHDLARTEAAADLRDRLRRLTEAAARATAASRQVKGPALGADAERQLRSLGYMR